MRFRFFLLLLTVTNTSVLCQSVSNVLAAADGDNVRISYVLAGEPTTKYDIRVSYSVDEENYKPIQKMSGDISQQLPGTGKSIIWQAKDELVSFNGFVRFKVELVGLSKDSSKDIAGTNEGRMNTSAIPNAATEPKKWTAENDDFLLTYLSHQKLTGGYKVKVKITPKKDKRVSFSKRSYAVDEGKIIYNLSYALSNGVSVMSNRGDFKKGVDEILDLYFSSNVSLPSENQLVECSLNYAESTSLVFIF
jgi:hypothetical protein